MAIFVGDDRVVKFVGVDSPVAEHKRRVVRKVEMSRTDEALRDIAASRRIADAPEDCHRRRHSAGIGCPNPAFYVLLTSIAGSGSLKTGLAYGLIHGIGRATPLLALSVLAILGVNATGWLLVRRERIQRAVGWGLVGWGAFIIPKGYLFGHAYWEESVFHKVWNTLVHLGLGSNIAESTEVERALGDMAVHDPWLLYVPWAVIALLVLIPILWDEYRRLRAGVRIVAHVEQTAP